MDSLSYKTQSARPSEMEQKWLLIDAENQVVGRLASRIAHHLRGKHKTNYTPNINCGDKVVVINAGKVRFTGKKGTDKIYQSYSGYPGGKKERSPQYYLNKRPEFILEQAIRNMLPKSRLGRDMFRNLHVYAGPEHPHQAQNPEQIEVL